MIRSLTSKNSGSQEILVNSGKHRSNPCPIKLGWEKSKITELQHRIINHTIAKAEEAKMTNRKSLHHQKAIANMTVKQHKIVK
jgi:hypothetical protein